MNGYHSQEQPAELLSKLVSSYADGIMLLSADGEVRYANPAAVRMLGRSGKELHDCRFDRRHRQGTQQEFEVVSRNGEKKIIEARFSQLQWDDESLRIVSLRDITQRWKVQKQLAERARRDSLTDLPNRGWMSHELDRMVSEARRYGSSLSVVMMDLDDFKAVNDRWGHGAGDELVKAFADTLRGWVRSADLPARYGGDEFAVVMPHTNLSAAVQMARRLRDEFARIEDHRNESRTTFSAGVAELGEEGTADSILKRADRGLYEAKSRGKDQIVAWPDDRSTESVSSDSDSSRKSTIPARTQHRRTG